MCDASYTTANVECTGVFCQEIYVAYSRRFGGGGGAFRYNDHEYMGHRIGITGDYHLFAKHGDKVYMEVKKVGEIVMSFAELQKNKYWKYYYDLSLMLAIDKEIKNEPFNKFYDEAYEYTGNRVWSLDTAYIDFDNAKKIYKIIPSGNVCYYKINPADLEKMEYASQQGKDIFKQIYMCQKTDSDVRSGYFLSRSVIYMNIAIEYQVSKMEKELEELSAFFENKQNIFTLAAIQKEHFIDNDVLMIIYENLVGNDKSDITNMITKINRARDAKTALELITHIIAT